MSKPRYDVGVVSREEAEQLIAGTAWHEWTIIRVIHDEAVNTWVVLLRQDNGG